MPSSPPVAVVESRVAEKQKVKIRRDGQASSLPPLEKGEQVIVRRPHTSWGEEAKIVDPRHPDNLSYNVEFEDGSAAIYNRQQIKKKIRFDDLL